MLYLRRKTNQLWTAKHGPHLFVFLAARRGEERRGEERVVFNEMEPARR